jgi:hypothetical protein
MSDLAYFEYALVLPEERYLIEVQTRKPDSGELRGPEEVERIARESLALAIGQGEEKDLGEFEPIPISESNAQMLKRVEQLLNRSESVVYLVE